MKPFFRRTGHCNRFPKSHKRNTQAEIRTGNLSAAVLMRFLEKADKDFMQLDMGSVRFPNRKRYRGKAYAEACKAVYQCLKAGTNWRMEDLQYLNQFQHPLYMLCLLYTSIPLP